MVNGCANETLQTLDDSYWTLQGWVQVERRTPTYNCPLWTTHESNLAASCQTRWAHTHCAGTCCCQAQPSCWENVTLPMTPLFHSLPYHGWWVAGFVVYLLLPSLVVLTRSILAGDAICARSKLADAVRRWRGGVGGLEREYSHDDSRRFADVADRLQSAKLAAAIIRMPLGSTPPCHL